MKKYLFVRDNLKTKILDKTYTTKLPSETELMKIYNVGRSTIRRAIDLLIDSGYVLSHHGKGVFILEQKEILDFDLKGIESFQEVVKRTGQKFTTEIKTFKKMIIEESLAKTTFFETDTVVRFIERIRILNHEKIIYDINYFNLEITKNLTEEQARGSIYNFLENEEKVIIALSKRTIAIEEATKADYQNLDMHHYNVVAVMYNHVYLDDGTLLEYTQSRHRPDKFVFSDVSRRNLHS
ncbi:MAG: UTRA domain-containing protein [Culicoidibacterales bacterium]